MPKKEVDPVVIQVGGSLVRLSEYGKFSDVKVRVLRHDEVTHSFGQSRVGKAPSYAGYVVKSSAVKGVFRRLQKRRFEDDVVFSWLGDDESQQQAAASDTEIAQAHAIASVIRVLGKIAAKKADADRRAEQELLIAQSLGLDSNTVPLPRFFPIRIFLGTGTASDEVSHAARKFCRAFGAAITSFYPPKAGSWFQKLIGRTEESVLRKELNARLEKAERALELAAINKVQSEIDGNLASAAAAIIDSLKGEQEAAIQLSSLLIVKHTDSEGRSRIATRMLTQQELMHIEQNPSVIERPREILELLDSVRKTTELTALRKHN